MYAATSERSNWRVAGTSAARERYAGNSLTMLEMSRFDKTWGGVAVCVRVHTIEPKTRCNGWEIIACGASTRRDAQAPVASGMLPGRGTVLNLQDEFWLSSTQRAS